MCVPSDGRSAKLARKAFEDAACILTRFPKLNVVVARSISLLDSLKILLQQLQDCASNEFAADSVIVQKILKFPVLLNRSLATTKADKRANGKDAKRAMIATSNISSATENF